MPRERKDCIKGTYSLARDIVEQLGDYSTESGIPRTIIIEKALAAYFAAHPNIPTEDDENENEH
ncbi:MAG: ribbon-helix-helix domain-containing protein [Prevotella sp.]|jgi:hypothetical protein|nr:ribbon-helix-helix domain-containing protein [Prevotella sp.]